MKTTVELSLDELEILQKALIKYCKSLSPNYPGSCADAVQLLHKIDDTEDDVLLATYQANKRALEAA